LAGINNEFLPIDKPIVKDYQRENNGSHSPGRLPPPHFERINPGKTPKETKSARESNWFPYFAETFKILAAKPSKKVKKLAT